MSAVVHRLPLVRPALGSPRRALPGIALDGEPRAPGGSPAAANGSNAVPLSPGPADTVRTVEGSTIEAALARADDLTAASDAAVTLLAAGGRLRATAYMARAGRLRSLASAGSSHVLDGVPVANGPVGRALRFGEEQREAARPGDSSGVICIPLSSGGRVAGVLAVAADDGLTVADESAARTAAAVLGRRMDELGGPPEEGPSSRLAQHAAVLAGLEDPARIERATLVAALDLAEMESAVLLRGEESGSLVARCAAGPLAHALLAVPVDELASLETLVADGASCATLTDAGPAAAPLPPALAALRSAGATTVIAAPLISRGETLGLLIVADARRVPTSTDRVELLELVAAQAASCLRAAAAVSELRHRAATDPLTGLGHRGTFHEALRVSHRRPVATAVALCDIDHFKELNDRDGHQAGDRALVAVADALEGALRRGDMLYRLGGDEFAAVLMVSDDTEALNAARRMREAVVACGVDVTVSIGVAVSGMAEDDDALVGRADRALYRAKAEGRDDVWLAPPARHVASAPGA